jgi:hypothetical protein
MSAKMTKGVTGLSAAKTICGQIKNIGKTLDLASSEEVQGFGFSGIAKS